MIAKVHDLSYDLALKHARDLAESADIRDLSRILSIAADIADRLRPGQPLSNDPGEYLKQLRLVLECVGAAQQLCGRFVSGLERAMQDEPDTEEP